MLIKVYRIALYARLAPSSIVLTDIILFHEYSNLLLLLQTSVCASMMLVIHLSSDGKRTANRPALVQQRTKSLEFSKSRVNRT